MNLPQFRILMLCVFVSLMLGAKASAISSNAEDLDAVKQPPEAVTPQALGEAKDVVSPSVPNDLEGLPAGHIGCPAIGYIAFPKPKPENMHKLSEALNPLLAGQLFVPGWRTQDRKSLDLQLDFSISRFPKVVRLAFSER